MKGKKQTFKFLAFLLSMILLSSVIPISSAAETGSQFTPSNLLRQEGVVDLENSKTTAMMWAHTYAVDYTNTRLNSKQILAKLIDGEFSYEAGQEPDISAYSNTDKRLFGVMYALTDSFYCGKLTLYAGQNDYYRVYASDTLDNLYWNENLSVVVGNASANGIDVTLNRDVKYIAVFYDHIRTYELTERGDDSTCGRPKEIELWSGDASTRFDSINLLTSDKMTEAKAIGMNNTTGSVIDYTSNNGKVAAVINGKADHSHTDMYTWNDGNIGLQFSFDNPYFIGDVIIDAGLYGYDESYDVYASESLNSLYSAESRVAQNAACKYANGCVVSVNKTARYVAVVNTANNGVRIRQILVKTADSTGITDPDAFISENVLRTHLTSSRCVQFYPTNYAVDDTTRIPAETIAALTDGNTTTKTDCYGGIDWTPARYIGPEFTLDAAYYIGSINLFAGYANMTDTFEVFASDSISTLYTEANHVGKAVVCDGTAQTVEIYKNVQYIAIVGSAYTYNMRIAEFETWTADPSVVKPNPSALKVLTIGNSFAENASIYASEIAYANGKSLTFGYLKFPSCTIEKHYQAASQNLAVFKFQITAPDGTRTTIKNEAASFDAPNAETSATIAEALQYTDWDVIVFQQESSTARDASTFADLGNLIDYVKGYLPDAKLMFHEVWRWGSWNADQFDLIKANTEAAARQYALTIIPSGLAFEKARTALGSDTIVNENDGNYQHAGTYGQYIAGACYVSALFGIPVAETTFASHPYVNDNGNVATLTAAANSAVTYYNSYGDADYSGDIDAADLTVLRQYLMEIGTVEQTLADVNNDGFINIKDLIRLKKILSA